MHPIAFSAQYEGDDRNRLTVFFRIFILIPWMVLGFFYGIGAFVATIVAWFAILFTGRYPQGLHDFNAGCLRWATRVNGFSSLLTDELPSFGGGEDPDYPIRTLVGPPLEEYDRMKTLFRIVLLIPVVILGYVHRLILGACSLIAWFVLVFTANLPGGLYKPMRISSAYVTKSLGYALLLTEDFPPFWQDEEDEAPRFDRLGAGLGSEPTTDLGL